MTTFLLVRHGHTDAVGHRLAGTAAGTPLSTRGTAEVASLVEGLRGVRIDAIVASPLTRTRQTAELVAASHGLQVEFRPEFIEYETGEWTGRTFADLDGEPTWRQFNDVRSTTRPPGGELMIEVQTRAVAALMELAGRHPGGTVLVVSHGDVIRAMVMYCLGTPVDFVHRLEISPARITIVRLAPGHQPVVWQVNGDSVPGGF